MQCGSFRLRDLPKPQNVDLVQHEIQAVPYMLKHDPAVVAGFLLIGRSSVFYILIQLKMVRAGYKTSFDVLRGPLRAKGLATPAQYLKVRTKHD